MIVKIQKWLDANKDMGILLLRLFVGARIIFGVWDNVVFWERMIEFRNFLEQFGFQMPLLCALLSVYAQLLSGILILVGFKIRVVSSIMILNFLVALTMVHLKDSFEAMTPALAMLFSCIVLLFYGTDQYTLERFVHSRKK